jgi:chromosome segregation ATPase
VLTVEALALGKPVIVYVREDLYEAHEPTIPVRNANPDTIKGALRDLITNVELRESLASQARPFVEQVHDVREVVRALRKVYEDVLDSPPKMPTDHADLDWFVARYKDAEASARERFQGRAAAADRVMELRATIGDLSKRLKSEREAYRATIARLGGQLAEERVAARARRDALRAKLTEYQGRIEALTVKLRAEREEHAAVAARLRRGLVRARAGTSDGDQR